MSSCNIENLLKGFIAAGGWINHQAFGLQRYESMGYGAVAQSDVQVSVIENILINSQTRLFSTFPISSSSPRILLPSSSISAPKNGRA